MHSVCASLVLEGAWGGVALAAALELHLVQLEHQHPDVGGLARAVRSTIAPGTARESSALHTCR